MSGRDAEARVDCSVVLPVYNEEECIEDVLRELHDALAQGLPGSFEIVAVNDGSTDATAAVLSRCAGQWPALRVYELVENTGQSAAFSAGFKKARGAYIVTMDADGQNDPADIPRLVAELGACDCCCGYRKDRQDTWSKRYGSKLANTIRNCVLKEDTIDTGCSLKAFRSGLVEDLTAWDGMHRFFPSLFLMRGATMKQLPVNHRTRSAGTSKYSNWGRLKKTVWDLRSVRWMKTRHVNVRIKEKIP